MCVTIKNSISALIVKQRKEREEREEKEKEEKREKERQEAEEMVRRIHEGTDSLEERLAVVSGQSEDKGKQNAPIVSDQVPEVVGETVEVEGESESTTDLAKLTKTPSSSSEDVEEEVMETEDGVKVNKDGKKHSIVTRSKTGSLTPRTFNMDDLKRRSKEEQEKLDRLKDEGDSTRLTRQKAHQIATGTHLFKLGMDNNFKSYVNQYTTNVISLNKPQRNEERDKKRHLSHKFSLTPLSEFKWIGSLTGTRALLVSTLRQTILQLESSIQAPFMHTNWPLLRKPWTTAVGTCVNPRDFARALIVLQACIKPVVFANVWNEQLGHVKLKRVTALEREEKKRLDKKEKKEKEDEEERNRLTYNFVKYTLGLKHQIWKQKGEEYRVHGQWGWLWISASRRYKSTVNKPGLKAGCQKIMVQIRDQDGIKILALDPPTYEFLAKEYCKPKEVKEVTEVKEEVKEEIKEEEVKEESKVKRSLRNKKELKDQKKDVIDVKEKEEEDQKENETTDQKDVKEEEVKDEKMEVDQKQESKMNLAFLAGMKIEKVFEPIESFEEIDIMKALTTPGRLHYPKIAKKCRIDDFLARRTHLKLLEERRVLQAEKTKEINQKNTQEGEEAENNEESDTDGTEMFQNILAGKPMNKTLSPYAREMMTVVGKRIQQVRVQYANIMRLGKSGRCYSKFCNMMTQPGKTVPAAQHLTASCYSPICLQKARLKRELLILMRKASALNNNQLPTITKTGEQWEKNAVKVEGQESKDAIRKDLESAVALATHCSEEVKAENVEQNGGNAKKIKLEVVSSLIFCEIFQN